ncbi:MAG: hypothetical protein AB1472_07800, partial [Candidatus Omnitrophota bacterium]
EESANAQEHFRIYQILISLGYSSKIALELAQRIQNLLTDLPVHLKDFSIYTDINLLMGVIGEVINFVGRRLEQSNHREILKRLFLGLRNDTALEKSYQDLESLPEGEHTETTQELLGYAYNCVPRAQLGFIILNLLGLKVGGAVTENHSFNVYFVPVTGTNKTMLIIDFALGNIQRIDWEDNDARVAIPFNLIYNVYPSDSYSAYPFVLVVNNGLSPSLYENLALVYRKLYLLRTISSLQPAFECAFQAQDASCYNVPGLFLLALLYANTMEFDKAEEFCNKALGIIHTHYRMGGFDLIEQQVMRLQAAIASLKEEWALEGFPEPEGLHTTSRNILKVSYEELLAMNHDYVQSHARRVLVIALEIAKQFRSELSDRAIEIFKIASAVHDFGGLNRMQAENAVVIRKRLRSRLEALHIDPKKHTFETFQEILRKNQFSDEDILFLTDYYFQVLNTIARLESMFDLSLEVRALVLFHHNIRGLRDYLASHEQELTISVTELE